MEEDAEGSGTEAPTQRDAAMREEAPASEAEALAFDAAPPEVLGSAANLMAPAPDAVGFEATATEAFGSATAPKVWSIQVAVGSNHGGGSPEWSPVCMYVCVCVCI